ncbi:MAG: hypothetical protein WD766_00425 [Gemmatimonadota bacterium]
MRYQRDFEMRDRPYPAPRGSGRFVGPRPVLEPGGRPRYDRDFGGRSGGPYGRDYWWIGERAMPSQPFGGRYDEAYRNFSERTHPHYSPVGGMQPGGGPAYDSARSPGRQRENVWFSDWTRWF